MLFFWLPTFLTCESETGSTKEGRILQFDDSLTTAQTVMSFSLLNVFGTSFVWQVSRSCRTGSRSLCRRLSSLVSGLTWDFSPRGTGSSTRHTGVKIERDRICYGLPRDVSKWSDWKNFYKNILYFKSEIGKIHMWSYRNLSFTTHWYWW